MGETKIILVTGLDGSGKSTFLNRLKSLQKQNNFKIIFVPHIDTALVKEGSRLHKASLFVNTLNHDADINKTPVLKTIAIFSAMLLFRKILELHQQQKVKTVFCERHPLIDTMVYAKYYIPKIGNYGNPKKIPAGYNEKYHDEICYLADLLPEEYIPKEKPVIDHILQFIIQWFFREKKTTIHDLINLFHVDLPDQIFFLKADPSLLFERLKNRELPEDHESIEILQMLDKTYEKIFQELNENRQGSINIIDTSDAKNLDALFETVKGNI